MIIITNLTNLKLKKITNRWGLNDWNYIVKTVKNSCHDEVFGSKKRPDKGASKYIFSRVPPFNNIFDQTEGGEGGQEIINIKPKSRFKDFLFKLFHEIDNASILYKSPSPRDKRQDLMPSSA